MMNDEMMLYVHVPFCVRKCDYCDFVSFSTGADVQDAYFNMLNKELRIKAELAGNRPVSSVFLGGGTPSHPDCKYICDTLENIFKLFNVNNDAEISMEMNPNSVTLDKLKAYKAAGVNRVSLGLQSTHNSELKSLSRIHTYEDFLVSYDEVRKAGFDNVNIDLMSAIPGQTLDSWMDNLNRVISLNPEHISAYSLILEEGTPFFNRYRDSKLIPDEDTDREMYHETKAFLGSKGYSRYEISNYAKKGYECRHNLGYWLRRDYLGIGLNAASLFDGIRYNTHKDLKKYLSGDFSGEREVLSKNDIMSEFMFLGLRLSRGIFKAEFYEKFDISMDEIYKTPLQKLAKEGLIINDKNVCLTDRGFDLANYCMSEFVL